MCQWRYPRTDRIALDCSAPCGVGERAGPAGDGVSSSGSDHALVTSALAIKETTSVLSVGSDEDCGATKVSLIILDARQCTRNAAQVRRTARTGEVYLGQPARQLRYAGDRSGSGGGERHLIGLSERGAVSEATTNNASVIAQIAPTRSSCDSF